MTQPLQDLPIVLASASPRRAELLKMLGLDVQILPAEIPEIRQPHEAPEAYVERLAREKAQAVLARRSDALVLAGDTTVAIGDDILEKPGSPDEAVAMLMRLQGREHRVATGLALAWHPGHLESDVEVTQVYFRPFTEAEAKAYVATGEPMDKAGGYGIQGMGGAFVRKVDGDVTAVVGLSIPLLLRLLERAGRPYRFPSPAGPAVY